MLQVLHLNGWLTGLVLIISIGLYKLAGYMIGTLAKGLGVSSRNLRLLIDKITLLIFNLILLWVLGLRATDLFKVEKIGTGGIWLIIGIGFGGLITYLTYQMIKSGQQGQKYSKSLGKVTAIDRLYIFLTLILFVGPAEDLLFLGVLQTVLVHKIGWWAVPLYMLIFSFYHYLNVIQGMETKQEFFGMLPVRLAISAILSLAYYQTGTLLYSIIIHNLFDTLNYLGLLAGVKAQLLDNDQSLNV